MIEGDIKGCFDSIDYHQLMTRVRTDHVSAEALNHEGEYDLVILALHRNPKRASEYSDRLAKVKPRLPILLLTDNGDFTPKGTLSPSIEAGSPIELMNTIASMLAGSTHIREFTEDTFPRASSGK